MSTMETAYPASMSVVAARIARISVRAFPRTCMHTLTAGATVLVSAAPTCCSVFIVEDFPADYAGRLGLTCVFSKFLHKGEQAPGLPSPNRILVGPHPMHCGASARAPPDLPASY